MSLEQQMKTGKLYVEFGHASEEDQAYEKMIEGQRMRCKELLYDYNHTRPSDQDTKNRILKTLLADVGESVWVEAPVQFSYGCNTHFGNFVYANFNLTIVDDCDVFVGDYVMFAPNVTITATGHPVWPAYRRKGAQFSLPVHIGNDVWIGSNTVILPGVTIGNNVVIGAGSVVTHDIPDNSVAFGSPCRVVRPITEADKDSYKKGFPLNEDWDR